MRLRITTEIRILFIALAATSLTWLAACGGGGGSGLPDAADGDATGQDVTDDTLEPDADEDLGEDIADTGDTTGDTAVDTTPPPMGDAGLSFVPVFGDGVGLQFDDAYRASMDIRAGVGQVLVMLCQTSDPTCTSPVLVHEVTDAEWEMENGRIPLQASFGPEMNVTGLPAGEYLLMIVYDNVRSRELGYGWDDGFETFESDWGGVVSEWDAMLSSQAADLGFNPPPEPQTVTLTDGQTLDLGEVMLSHIHERQLTEAPPTEDGLIVVGLPGSGTVRIVDLSTHTLVPAYEVGGVEVPDFTMLDAAGDAIAASVCNVVAGADATVWVVFDFGDGSGAAVPFDPSAGEQLAGQHVVTFPSGPELYGPCRMTFHESGGQQYLFAQSSGSSNDQPRAGTWFANVTDLASGDIEATLLTGTDDALFDEPLSQLAAHGDTLYLSGRPGLEPCNPPGSDSDVCVFRASIDATTGRPTVLRDGAGELEIMRAGTLASNLEVPGIGTVGCSAPLGLEYAGVAIAPFAKTGQDLMFVSLCLEVVVFDLANHEALDFSPAPGVQGLPIYQFGQGIYDFELDPAGEVLWGAPSNKSPLRFYTLTDVYSVETDRHMLVPIDLRASVAGDLPDIAPEYATTNRDGLEGLPDDGAISPYPTPAEDPGISLRNFELREYLVQWVPGLAGGVGLPVPTGSTLAVGRDTVWLRAAHQNNGGLLDANDVATYDLTTQRMVLWPQPDGPDDFYHPWTGARVLPYGYDLDPTGPSPQTSGLVWVPRQP